jgi:hypothetical protein
MDPAFRDHRKNDWGHLTLRLDNATRDSNAGQIGAFLAKGWLLGTQRRAGGSSNRAVMVGRLSSRLPHSVPDQQVLIGCGGATA